MSNNYESGTVDPFFPTEIVRKYDDALGEIGCSTHEEVQEGLTYIYFEEGMNDSDLLVETLQSMLKEADIDYCTVNAAAYCDKMRPGEFGGWCCFVTKDDAQWMNTGHWLWQRENEFKKSKQENYMSTGAALQLVYELAEQGALSQQEARENDLTEEMKTQTLALETVHDFIVNEFGE